MKLKVKITTLIERCAGRLTYLNEKLAALESEQANGQWRTDLSKELATLSEQVKRSNMASEDISTRLNELRSLIRAESLEYEVRDVRREIKKVENTQRLLVASSATDYGVDSTDAFWMSILNEKDDNED